jgi:hypothetical protein
LRVTSLRGTFFAAAMDEYYRRDQQDGISPPDLSKMCTYAEHIVHARGKRTQFTSVSKDQSRIRDFGPALYKLQRVELVQDNHQLIEHALLIASLRTTIQSRDKAERARAIQALRYAQARVEGLVQWTFKAASVEPKDLLNWAHGQVQKYFVKA